MATALDDVENLLTHLICADATGDILGAASGKPLKGRGLEHSAVDAGARLCFAPMKPRDCYTTQRRADRLYTTTPGLLLKPAQEVLGDCAEVAMLCDDRVKWTGFRAINRAPRNLWVAKRGASLYEVHYREILASGASTYAVRVAALDRAGNPVLTQIIGSRGTGGPNEGDLAVMLASVIEDAHRPHTLLAKISDATSIRIPVPIDEHRELFSLRDAPLTSAGRRKAILHWVAKHTRLATKHRVDVSAHWRGTRALTIDGMTVELTPND